MSTDGTTGPAPDHRAGRQRRLVAFLRGAGVAVFVLAVTSIVVPGEIGDDLGIAMVVVLVAAPAVRVAWLTRRWFAKGDRPFAAAAVLLLLVVAAGAAFALT